MAIPASVRRRPRNLLGAEGPAPGFGESVGAAFRTARDDQPTHSDEEVMNAYGPLVEALADLGHPVSRYVNAGRGGAAVNEDVIWADIAAARARDPRAFSGVPTDAEAFRAQAMERFKTRNQQDRATVERSGWAPWLVGSFGAGLTDPLNVGAMVVTGGGSAGATLLRRSATEALVNAGTEAVEQPMIAVERAKRGESLSLGEAAANVVVAGTLGAALPVAGAGGRRATEAVAGKIYAALPDRVVQAIGSDRMTLDERAAADVLRREDEIDTSSPFRQDGAGVQAHRDSLSAAMSRILSDRPVRSDAPGIAPRARALAGTRGQGIGSGARLDPAIVGFFEGKGFSSEQARGIAAGIAAESRNNHSIINPTSGAFGLGQWLGSRKAELFRRYGRTPTRDQQLEFLHWELTGGDHGGAAVRGARDAVGALGAYIRKFMRPAAGKETIGDLDRGMAALGQSGERLPADEAGALDAPAAVTETASSVPAPVRPSIADLIVEDRAAVPTIAGSSVPPMEARQVPASAVMVDAQLMQFKSGGDAFGVTDRLQGVEQWNPLMAGRQILWERRDGALIVADGHQRVGLARRIGAKEGRDIPLDTIVLREADGVTAGDARMLAAAKNIAEGTGTVIDAAKVIREGGPRLLAELPPRSVLVRDGASLSHLSDDAFGAVVNGVVKPEHAAPIGQLLPDDPAAHIGLVDLLAKAKPANRLQAESIVRQGIAAGFFDGVQTDMFGSLDTMASLFLQRAKVLDGAVGQLRKLKSVFKVAGRNAETIESGGVGSIDTGRAAKEALDNEQAIELVQRLANSAGPIKDAIDAAARRLADGEPVGKSVDGLVRDIRAIDLRTALMVRDDAERAARLGHADGFDDPVAEPVDTATLSLFGDPAGTPIAEQTASMTHDLQARKAAEGEGLPPGDLDRLGFLPREDGPAMTPQQLRDQIARDDDAINSVRGCLK